jgi:hypothetical protein
MKMNTPLFCGICISALIMFSAIAEGGLIVNPVNPTPDDSVSIEFSTWLPNPGVVVTGTDQTIDGYDIFLDLHTYQRPGIWKALVVPLKHTFSIDNLPVGIYQVQANQPYDIQSTSFEVIPEPNSVALLLLGSGTLYLRRKKYKRVELTRYNARRVGRSL